jgi:hypothetical protein
MVRNPELLKCWKEYSLAAHNITSLVEFVCDARLVSQINEHYGQRNIKTNMIIMKLFRKYDKHTLGFVLSAVVTVFV